MSVILVNKLFHMKINNIHWYLNIKFQFRIHSCHPYGKQLGLGFGLLQSSHRHIEIFIKNLSYKLCLENDPKVEMSSKSMRHGL